MVALTEPSKQWGISRNFGPDGHNGIDYKFPTGTPVYAAADGVVVFEGWGQNHSWITWMGGISILVKHDDIYTGYSHLQSTAVNNGQQVKRGQLIGHSASTGNSTGPHLHFDVLPLTPNFKNGYSGRINPNPYFNNQQGEEPVVENNDAHKGRVGRIFKQTRGRYMKDEEFPQFVGLTYLRVNEVLGDNQEAFDNERRAELGAIAGRDNWAQQIADRTAERDWANAAKESALKEAAKIETENKELKEQLANQSEDTTLLNGFGEFLNKLIARLGVKKEK